MSRRKALDGELAKVSERMKVFMASLQKDLVQAKEAHKSEVPVAVTQSRLSKVYKS